MNEEWHSGRLQIDRQHFAQRLLKTESWIRAARLEIHVLTHTKNRLSESINTSPNIPQSTKKLGKLLAIKMVQKYRHERKDNHATCKQKSFDPRLGICLAKNTSAMKKMTSTWMHLTGKTN